MGKVYLVGAGPGAADLITVKGLKCIQKAEVILYDRLVNPELLEYANERADLIFCGKLPKYHAMKQETINHFLIKHALQGKTVVRLKGGDPFVFGRGAEEAEALVENGISFEVVPGITSGIAAPLYAGIPVTHRKLSSSFALVTGHQQKGSDKDIQWEHLAKGVDTIAIYMGVSHLPLISEKLMDHGRPGTTPAAVIYMGTTGNQQTVTATLETLADKATAANVKNPSVIIIGEVVTLREKIKWFEQLSAADSVGRGYQKAQV
ncbi:uroporphyrinogen-III C-methyltransferase [Alteribacillus iranensis]|uniref:Uroporphyrinogen-III C-methyltransferase n=1 Tax=Alteribacillus iranensis TaxID=930128 RepID=A0A1I1ZXD6_9BACI|nr:uroporphyrinogen-III C-methyltransferase [Alteribacillus iranensis]SFE36361.1 uroporphyrinogen-III C-methyltransferase [Alteribacillus iranensis]